MSKPTPIVPPSPSPAISTANASRCASLTAHVEQAIPTGEISVLIEAISETPVRPNRRQLAASETMVAEIAKSLARLAAQRDHDGEQRQQAGASVRSTRQ